jgi:16S rRNA (guanine(966)-N(2))-methyltransferase RsmD
MRVLSGKYKGKRLYAGKDLSIRPTTNRIKETIFNILYDFCSNKNVIDLFSGSGSLGIEALSRGAASVTFLEHSESSLKVLKQNINLLGIDLSQSKIVKSDVFDYCQRTSSTFDLILIDPPFNFPELQKLIDLIFSHKILENDGILVIQHEISNPLNEQNQKYKIVKQKKIGRSIISFILVEDKNVL